MISFEYKNNTIIIVKIFIALFLNGRFPRSQTNYFVCLFFFLVTLFHICFGKNELQNQFKSYFVLIESHRCIHCIVVNEMGRVHSIVERVFFFLPTQPIKNGFLHVNSGRRSSLCTLHPKQEPKTRDYEFA